MAKESKMSTKERIMRAAAKMFSDSGYDKVTMREIAAAVGINPASIYNHFSSKDNLLKSLYKLYSEERIKACPDLNELLRLSEIKPPHEVLMKSEFHFDDEKREMLDQILVTAAREICADPESERFIRENIFNPIDNVLRPLLLHMIEYKKIKPLNIDSFFKILSFYCFSAAALNNSSFKQNATEYQAGMSSLFSMIIPME